MRIRKVERRLRSYRKPVQFDQTVRAVYSGRFLILKASCLGAGFVLLSLAFSAGWPRAHARLVCSERWFGLSVPISAESVPEKTTIGCAAKWPRSPAAPQQPQSRTFRMINVGVIGVGTEWEEYLPVLKMLRRSVGVRAVYDSVRARAEQAAVSLSAANATGLSQLAHRHDIQAIFLMDAGWAGPSSVDVLSRCGKPVFIRPWLTTSASFYERIFDRASHAGLMLMPAMWRRFMPSTMRLQELFATNLGQPVRLELHLDLPACPMQMAEQLVGWLDFSRNLFRTYPVGARLESTGERSLQLFVEYSSRETSSPCLQACVTISAQDCDAEQVRGRLREAVSDCRAPRDVSSNGQLPPREMRFPEINCECESGWATLLDRTSLTWCCHDDEGVGTRVRTKEELSSERTESQVMLDLFCRRLVGGLVPVADFSDISRALRLVESAL